MRAIATAAVALTAGLGTAAWAQGAAEPRREGGVRAVLEMSQEFLYAGDPILVRISIGNDGDKEVKNPVKGSVLRGFVVEAAGGKVLERAGSVSAAEPARPERLAVNSFYGTILDLVELFPGLGAPGQYAIRWSADGVESRAIALRVIPKYDPAKEYRARVETDEGTFVIEFLKRASPVAVKTFIDLANSGYYDGLLFHEVRPEWFIAGGDPAGDGSGVGPFRFPQELSPVPIVAGSVLFKPVAGAPPANGSQFVIALRPEPTWAGQLTVFGQVIEGLEVVQRISRLPSSQQASRPFYKPLEDVRTRRIVVFEKAPVPEIPSGERD